MLVACACVGAHPWRISNNQGVSQRLSLLKTAGYQWYKLNKNKPNRIMRIDPKDKYTVFEAPEFLLGSVSNLWAIASSAASNSGKSLK